MFHVKSRLASPSSLYLAVLASVMVAILPSNVSAQDCKPVVIGFHGAKSPEIMWDLLSEISRESSEAITIHMVGWDLTVDMVVWNYPVRQENSAQSNVYRYLRDYRRGCAAPIVLIGHSYGGSTAYRVARRADWSKVLLVTLDAVSNFPLWRGGFNQVWWTNVYSETVVPRWVAGLAILGNLLGSAERHRNPDPYGDPFGDPYGNPYPFPDQDPFRGVDMSGGRIIVSSEPQSGCNLAATGGAQWGGERGANQNVGTRKDHCDLTGLYGSVSKSVLSFLEL